MSVRYPSPPKEQIHGTPEHPPGAPLRLRPTQGRDLVVELNLFDLNGSPTKVKPLKSKDLSGAPMKQKPKSKRPCSGSVAVCQRRQISTEFHPSAFLLLEFLTDFGSHASPLQTAKLNDKKRARPRTPVKQRRSLF
jgi:hypothetical protein